MGIKLTKVAISAFSLFLLACTPEDEAASTSTELANAWANSEYRCGQRSLKWQDVNDWHYQLTDMDYQELANSRYDLLVIDSEPFIPPNRNIIDRLKCAGDGEKLLVSYMAVGQAEEYRYYWQDDWSVGNPSWIVYPDQFWPGDYYVRYWEPEWKQILMGTPQSRVDRIIEAGFDGVYLDTIDAYTFFIDENPNAIADMQSLVLDIANYARAKSGNPDFGVFVQNAEELIYMVGPEWVAPLTGIGKEEPFFWATDVRVDNDQRYWNDFYLSQWVDAGKLVLNVDYVTTEANRREVVEHSVARGYVPLTLSSKNLDRMDRFPGYLPD
ncbi:MAG: endo alpha-1,4 polygalactosaminidase [Gammaproteobacteria bacterium]|nr:endo alpha-1,4 polygalactosaminidase [Gammaproteobacteria bacterium]